MQRINSGAPTDPWPAGPTLSVGVPARPWRPPLRDSWVARTRPFHNPVTLLA